MKDTKLRKPSSIGGGSKDSGKSSSISSCKLVVNKPQAIVIDLMGVLVNKSFMTNSNEFRSFFQSNLSDFLTDYWKHKQLRITINFFRCSQQNVPEDYKLADRDESREDQIKQAKRHVMWKWKNEPNNSALSLFFLVITEWGYKNKLLQTGIYDEVPSMLKQWREIAKVPVYVGVGSADFLVMILSSTTQGNILPLFNGHMNIMDFDGTKANKDFRKLIAILRLPADRVLYLTRFRRDCKKAIEAGLQSVIVLRPDFDISNAIPILKSRRGNSTVIDGTAKNKPTTTAPDDQIVSNKAGNKLNSLEDTEDASTISSAIADADLSRYNVVLSLSEIAFK